MLIFSSWNLELSKLSKKVILELSYFGLKISELFLEMEFLFKSIYIFPFSKKVLLWLITS
jgi:hypothetical protein